MIAALAAAGLIGCASRSADVLPRPADPAAYAVWDCERLFDETDTVQHQAAELAYSVDSRVSNNILALGVGLVMFWPALLAMQPDGPQAAELAELKGRHDALRAASEKMRCGEPADTMAEGRRARLPVALGERLVYDERSGSGGVSHTLGMTVIALRRDRIEFRVDLDGQAFAASWQQDLAGNPVLEARPPLIAWRRLLKPDLVLGQVLSGELAAADEPLPSARLRGQVVATGPQKLAGRNFDVAVIELFGEAALTRGGQEEAAQVGTRLDGVMAIDRRSGVLLRLEMRSADSDFVLRRRLLRIEPAPR